MKISIKYSSEHMSGDVVLAPSLSQLFMWIGDNAAPEHPEQWPNASRPQKSSSNANILGVGDLSTQPNQHH